jgi:hypothetical protein
LSASCCGYIGLTKMRGRAPREMIVRIEALKSKVPAPLRPVARLLYHSVNRLLARPPEFVIVGTGRCGTGFTSEYLTRIGVHCSHEGYYTPHGPTLRNPERLFLAKGDASWLAVPFLENADLPVLHQVRHPRDVIRSLMKIGFFDPALHRRHGAFIAFAERYFQPGGDPLESSIRWYLEWNQRCEEVAEYRFRVEDFEAALPEILHRIGYRHVRARAAVSTSTNTKRKEIGEDLDSAFDEALAAHALFPRLTELAGRYGYSLDPGNSPGTVRT